jgi:hypothetical protein
MVFLERIQTIATTAKTESKVNVTVAAHKFTGQTSFSRTTLQF